MKFDVKRGEMSGRSAESDLFDVLDEDILGSRYFLHYLRQSGDEFGTSVHGHLKSE